jgi:hypothetical protein
MGPVLRKIARHLAQGNHPYRFVVCTVYPKGMVNVRKRVEVKASGGAQWFQTDIRHRACN